jgi:hypothetical protein
MQLILVYRLSSFVFRGSTNKQIIVVSAIKNHRLLKNNLIKQGDT